MKKQTMMAAALAFLLTGYTVSLHAENAPPAAAAPAAAAPAAAPPAAAAPAAAAPAAAAPAAPATTAPASGSAAAAAPATASAPAAASTLGDVSGTYDVHGKEAVSKDDYQGVAMVTKTGEVYSIQYQDNESTVQGVGLVDGGIFSIAYISEGTPAVLILKTAPDGTLKGPWAYKGENFASSETWKRR
ncbi:MAG: hypothetical protein HQL89_09755 [Magnetococcales bacterium]|nr:hypothetical protein [Magnetococcales bacterium]